MISISSQVSAQSAEIRGTVAFEDGTAIPKGEIRIYIDQPADQGSAQDRTVETEVGSDGGSRAIAFALPPPTGSTALPGTRIVARLERADGWLLARGSAELTANAPVSITLHPAIH